MTGHENFPNNGAEHEDANAHDDGAIPAASAEPDPVSVLEAEKVDLKERLMRALAEMENLRRRSEREATDARTYAVTNFARDMLAVADNVRRALESVPKERRGRCGAAAARRHRAGPSGIC